MTYALWKTLIWSSSGEQLPFFAGKDAGSVRRNGRLSYDLAAIRLRFDCDLPAILLRFDCD